MTKFIISLLIFVFIVCCFEPCSEDEQTVKKQSIDYDELRRWYHENYGK